METIERYDGPFDVVLIDHLKGRYADAYRAVLPKVRTGGVIVADNITRGPIDFGDLVAHFEDGAPLPDPEVDGETRGIGEYVGTVRSDEAVETAILRSAPESRCRRRWSESTTRP